ncbi:mitochondrial outer membrane protein porin of 34 kDa-like [Manihot esculenta]|uniref:mitochondrial outer membrane protein porin of 34 kDa-like n=1 Tax=Manihot esculenta TaxID=3983 RepID=UPI001CC4F821|nr:mitochondrial outer membrane protein porin of 34 kDa-like [Manihot esculenta]
MNFHDLHFARFSFYVQNLTINIAVWTLWQMERCFPVAITSTGVKKGELFVADVNTQLKNKNITTDVKVDTDSNLLTTITFDEPAPGLKAILSFKVPDQRSGKMEIQYLHDFAAVSSSIGLTPNPIVNFSGVIGSNVTSLGADLSFDTKTGNFTKCNAGLSYSSADLVASLTFNDKGDSLKASYYHIVNPLLAAGAEVSHSFLTNENTITVGSQYALDPLITLKAKFEGKYNGLQKLVEDQNQLIAQMRDELQTAKMGQQSSSLMPSSSDIPPAHRSLGDSHMD